MSDKKESDPKKPSKSDHSTHQVVYNLASSAIKGPDIPIRPRSMSSSTGTFEEIHPQAGSSGRSYERPVHPKPIIDEDALIREKYLPKTKEEGDRRVREMEELERELLAIHEKNWDTDVKNGKGKKK